MTKMASISSWKYAIVKISKQSNDSPVHCLWYQNIFNNISSHKNKLKFHTILYKSFLISLFLILLPFLFMLLLRPFDRDAVNSKKLKKSRNPVGIWMKEFQDRGSSLRPSEKQQSHAQIKSRASCKNHVTSHIFYYL